MIKQRKLILIAAVIGILSTFLPWISVSAGAFGYSVSQSENGFRGIGILYFVLLAIVAVIAAMGDKKAMLEKNMRLAVIGAGALAVICLLIAYSGAKERTSGGFGVVNASIGVGLILSFFAALCVTVIPLLIKQSGESLSGDLDRLKNNMKSLQGSVASAVTPKPQVKMNELEKLITWRSEGKISEEEYQDLKSKLL